MTTRLNPYISFQDETRQAVDFYQSILGGNLTMTTFKDAGMSDDDTEGAKIMHAQLETENGMMLMASDSPKEMEHASGTAISISLSGDDEQELRGYYDKLAVGGTVALPLDKAPWGDYFGIVVDKFGVSWMVNIAGEHPESAE